MPAIVKQMAEKTQAFLWGSGVWCHETSMLGNFSREKWRSIWLDMSCWYWICFLMLWKIQYHASLHASDRKSKNAYIVNFFEGYYHQPIWTKQILFPSNGWCFSSYCHDLMIYWPFSKGLNIPNQHVNCFGWDILILTQSRALWTDGFFNVFFAVATNSYSDWSIRHTIGNDIMTFHVLYCLERSCRDIAHLPNAAKTGPGDSSRTWTCGACHTRGLSFLGGGGFLGGLAETWRLTLLA